MKKQDFIKEAQAVTFGLKNFEASKIKHADPTKYDPILNELKQEDDTDELADEIVSRIVSQVRWSFYQRGKLSEAKKTGEKIRTALRELKTAINAETFAMNTEEIARRADIKASTARRYATSYYVLNYKPINRAMKQALLDLTANYI